MKFELFAAVLIACLVLSGAALAAKPVVNPNMSKYEVARLLGGSQSHFFYEGVDTICQPAQFDTVGYDSSLVTDWLQVSWYPDSSGTYPNWKLNDSLTWMNGREFWLWLEMDTTTLRYASGDTLSYRGSTVTDSCGFQQIFVEYKLKPGDDAAWYADSSNWVAYDGAFTDVDYGTWVYEERGGASGLVGVPIAGRIGKWWIFNVKVPLCSAVRITIQAPDNMREFSIYKWRLACAH